jgi:hypothetical protein
MKPTRKQIAQGGYSSGTLQEASIDGANYPRGISKQVLTPLSVYRRDPSSIARMSRPALVSLCKRMNARLEELEGK